MISFWDWFQVISLILFVLITIAKAVLLRVRTGIDPIVIGRGKKGFQLASYRNYRARVARYFSFPQSGR